MVIKETNLFTHRLICLLFIFSSFSHFNLTAGAYQDLSSQGLSPQRLPSQIKSLSYEDLSWINQKFHDFANALFRYDARIKNAQEQLKLLQKCLGMPMSSVVRMATRICAGLTNEQLQEKIDVLEIKIAELAASKNRIVTMQDALKKYWYTLIPIIAAGGGAYLYVLRRNLVDGMRELTGDPNEGFLDTTLENVTPDTTSLVIQALQTPGLTPEEKYDMLMKELGEIEKREKNRGRLQEDWDDARRVHQEIEALKPELDDKFMEIYGNIIKRGKKLYKEERQLRRKSREEGLTEAEKAKLEMLITEGEVLTEQSKYYLPLLGDSTRLYSKLRVY